MLSFAICRSIRQFTRFFSSRFAVFLSAICICLCFPIMVSAAQLLLFEGKAKHPDSDALLYTEKHRVIMNDDGEYLSSFVEYLDPQGRVFAEKTLEFEKNKFAPDMMFHDHRSDQRVSVYLNLTEGKDSVLQLQLERGQNREETMIDVEPPFTLVDGGFDRFIHGNWQRLRQEKKLAFSFLAVTRSTLIDFEIEEIAADEATVFFELRPQNFFINLLVEPISLEYDINTKRLSKFSGLTNIERFIEGEASDENHVAEIQYTYEALKPFITLNTRRESNK